MNIKMIFLILSGISCLAIFGGIIFLYGVVLCLSLGVFYDMTDLSDAECD